MRARFAPSPTGDLHLGGAYIAAASFARVKASESPAAFVVRVEDLDPPRVVAGAERRILDDLAWLGLHPDEGVREGGAFGPYRQSERHALYDGALSALAAQGLTYPCTCTRAEISRIASAPHGGDEGPRYPGTCRDPANRKADRPAAVRLRVPDDARAHVRFDDLGRGAQQQDVAEVVGDFVLRRADGVYGYQLAVVADDLAMAIDEVVRGEDLLTSTPRQLLLAEMLRSGHFVGDRAPIRYGHLPLVRAPDGERLAKRHQGVWLGSTVDEIRAQGVSPAELRAELTAAFEGVPAELGLEIAAMVMRVARVPLRERRGWTPPNRWLRARARPLEEQG